MKLRYLFYVLVLSLPFFGFPLVNLGGFPLRWDWVFMLAIVLGYLILVGRGQLDSEFNLSRALIFLLAFQIFIIVSIWEPLVDGSAGALSNYLTTYLQYILTAGFFIVATQLNFKRRTLLVILRLYVIVAIVVASFGILQFVLGNFLQLEWVYLDLSSAKYGASRIGYTERFGVQRSPAIFLEPRHFGNFLVTPFCLLAATGFFDSIDVFGSRYRRYLAMTILGAGILVSLSASAYGTLMLSIGAVLLIVSRDIKSLIRQFGVLSIIVVAVISLILVSPLEIPIVDVLSRLTLNSYELTNLFNFDVYLGGLPRYIRGFYVAVDFALHHPLTGVGLNQMGTTIDVSNLIVILPPADLLIAIGPIGFSLFILFLWQILIRPLALRNRLRSPISMEYALLSIALLFVATAVIKSGAGSRFNYVSPWFWFDITLAAVLYWHVKEYCRHQFIDPHPEDSPRNNPDSSVVNH